MLEGHRRLRKRSRHVALLEESTEKNRAHMSNFDSARSNIFVSVLIAGAFLMAVSTQRIEMLIPAQYEAPLPGIHDDCLEAPLKEVANAPVLQVEIPWVLTYAPYRPPTAPAPRHY